MKNQIQFNNINFSNPADVPIMILLLLASKDEESTEHFKKYLEEYKENIKKEKNMNERREKRTIL